MWSEEDESETEAALNTADASSRHNEEREHVAWETRAESGCEAIILGHDHNNSHDLVARACNRTKPFNFPARTRVSQSLEERVTNVSNDLTEKGGDLEPRA